MKTKARKTAAPRRCSALLGALIGALAVLALIGPASALAAPVLEVSSSHLPASVPAGTYAQYAITVSNTGDEPTNEPITVDFSLPAGVKVTAVTDEVQKQFGLPTWSCPIAPDSQSFSCTGPALFAQIESGKEACQEAFGGLIPHCRILITVRAASGASPGPLTPTITACGGGATTCPTVGATAPDDPLDIVPFDFHIVSFDGEFLEHNGDPATQAGSHPHSASNEFFLSTFIGGDEREQPTEQLKDGTVKLPPGLIGNPQAVSTCTQEQLLVRECPEESQIGLVTLFLTPGGLAGSQTTAGVYNMQTPPGTAATPIGTPGLFAFNALSARIQIYAKLRSGEDYGVTLLSKNAPQTLSVLGANFEFWGVPADPSHNGDRGNDALGRSCGDLEAPPSCSHPSSGPLKPFISLPTSCVEPVETFLEATSWLGGSDSTSFLTHAPGEPLNTIGNHGCNALDFSPTVQARPTTNVADAPSGLDVNLHIPQSEACDTGPQVSCQAAEAHLRNTTVTLPEGLVINPSGANGLGACTEAQFGYTNTEDGVIHTTPDPATCPDDAKLGTVQVDSPLLDHPLKGAVYIAQPYQNPFNSLLALYIAIDDPRTGVVVKLAGVVHPDPNTGRLTTTFTENPQLPFEDFELHFFGGARGALRTPALCGTYTTTSSLTPWSAPESGPPATPSDPWSISRAPSGGACPSSEGARPNGPDLDAGTVSPIAGTYSPMVISLRRQDGSQQFSTVSLTPPPGLLGKLAGIPYCSEAALVAAASKRGQAEKSSPSCPAASQVGTVDVAAGAGPAPYNAQGTAYLSGPYKGAPLSLAIITPATAGPFDLGTVVVRTALAIDPATARITATSDPIPAILQGVPLDVRSAQIRLDRPSFTLNPTSCDPLAFSGSLVSTLGQSASLAERFQVGECGRLAFKPKLGFRLRGGTKRGAHPALRAVLRMPVGSANIARASVALPHSEFLDQAHIGTVCTRVQYAAQQCPAASVYGKATAFSPLLDAPLSGPVYLRSSDHKLPDLVASLDGQIHVDIAGRVDSVNGGIRTSFEAVPDAAVSEFVLEMAGARKGLLQNSTDICQGKHLATAQFEAQNGKFADLRPPLKAQCKKPRKGKSKRAPTAPPAR